MIDILKEILPRSLGADPEGIEMPVRVERQPFARADAKACKAATKADYAAREAFDKYRHVCQECNHVVLKVNNSGQEISVVDFEEYISQLPQKETAGKHRCDLLMSDGEQHKKIVFCELCCYDEKYIEPNDSIGMPQGKRAQACRQMKESVEFFLREEGNTVVAQHILTYSEKVGLFAYRSYACAEQLGEAPSGKAEANMWAMLRTPSAVSEQVITEEKIQVITEDGVMEHGFRFVRNKYPKEYCW